MTANVYANEADALEMSRPKHPEPDLPVPERWQLGRMEVDGRTYERGMFVCFATVEEYKAALRQADLLGWFNA